MAATTESTRKQMVAELQKEIQNFITGAAYSSKVSNVDLTRSAVYLLKTLPAAREAVLEYLCSIFDDAVSIYFTSLEARDSPGEGVSAFDSSSESLLEEVINVLSGFIGNNPTAWAPVIAAWALELLGQLSSKYSDRRSGPPSVNLNENVQLWMNCRPTRILVQLTTQCLATLIDSDPDACIAALLDTSVKHSPHFDWVVAHIGSCFPTTVVTRVLSCGLQDFYTICNDVNQQHYIAIGEKTPKLASVVGILGHLVGQHKQEIKQAILQMFQFCVQDPPPNTLPPNNVNLSEQQATLPFLLQLAKISPTLLSLLTADFFNMLTPHVVNILYQQISQWPAWLKNNLNSMRDLVVHLILSSSHGGPQIITFLLDTASPSPGRASSIYPPAQYTCGIILDHLIVQIQQTLFSDPHCSEIPVLTSLEKSLSLLCARLLDIKDKKSNWCLTLLVFTSVYCGEHVSAGIVTHIITNAHQPSHLLFARSLLQQVQGRLPSTLSCALQKLLSSFRQQTEDTNVRIIINLLQLVHWGELNMKPILYFSFDESLRSHIPSLSWHLTDPHLSFSYAVAKLLSLHNYPDPLPPNTAILIGNFIVIYFFNLLREQDPVFKTRGAGICHVLVQKLIYSTAAQELVIRHLLEGALHSTNCDLLGGKPASTATFALQRHTRLSEENWKHSNTITLPQSHSTVFHSGVIERYPNRSMVKIRNKIEVVTNSQLFTSLLQVACNGVNQAQRKQTVSGVRMLALLMVELVSSDVMFNGLPWPDEEYTKVTVERDLHIKRMFDSNPILWSVLWYVAYSRPNLCYCSVLLRGLLATMQAHWSSTQEVSAGNSPKQLEITRSVVDIMAVGQFLPPPLSRMGELLPNLKSFEVQILLSDVWNYMKENVPSPAAFTLLNASGQLWRDFGAPCSIKYTERLHHIIQMNIEKFATLYSQFCEDTPVMVL